jgi:hypothetical protein
MGHVKGESKPSSANISGGKAGIETAAATAGRVVQEVSALASRG